MIYDLRFISVVSCFLVTMFSASASADWIDLFDGKTTEGWNPRSEVISFEAKEGELHLLSKTNCWVTTEIQMSDFEAEIEVLMPKEEGFNSGLAFRCIGSKGRPKGYQCEIDRQKPAGVYGIGNGGWIYPGKGQGKEFADKIRGNLKKNDWNHFRVRAVGDRIQTWLNGTPVSDIKHGKILKGYFGVQHHGKGGTVRFRKIRAREISNKKVIQKIQERPNILWITAEDMSPTLGCYGDKYAITPNIDQLARSSTRYSNAFAASPVCSPSRSVLITGMHNVSTGTHQMRSGFPLPTGVKGFPAYMRESGYFTTNNVKTDYNSSDAPRLIKESWNESSPKAHWRNSKRRQGQPFFSVFNIMTSHQSRSMVWPYPVFKKHVQSKLSASEIHDPKKAPVPDYYPDTPLIRKTISRYYDCVTAMDKRVGEIMNQLREDGLADSTIVFFFSDHGSGMPRHKRLLHDSGMKVAMLVHVPERWKHLRPTVPGSVTDRLVSFVDFAPTVLGLVDLKSPKYMQGIPFLGVGSNQKRKFVFGNRDRVDEVFDCSRSVRDKRWLYIRNYHPHLSWSQPSVFSDLGEIRHEIFRVFRENPDSSSVAQRHYAGSTRPSEELYDCEADPDNTRNLISEQLSDEAGKALKRLRLSLVENRNAVRDLGALPESEMRRWIKTEGSPMRDIVMGKTAHSPDLQRAWAAADKVGTSDSKELLRLLKNGNVNERYWAAVSLRNGFFEDKAIQQIASEWIQDVAPSVRIEIAGWLASFPENREASLNRLVKDLEHPDWAVALQACRAIELLGPKARPVLDTMKKIYSKTRHEPGDNNFFIAFSSGAFLERLGEKTDPWDFSPGAVSFMPAKKKSN